jgi:hypothetical protein
MPVQHERDRLDELIVEHTRHRASVGRVRAVRAAFGRRHSLVLDERLIVVQRQRGADVLACPRRAGIARERVGLAVGTGVHGAGSELTREPCDLVGAVPAPHEQASAELAQPLVEIAQALEQEADARRRAILAAEDPGIEDERARDQVAACDGCSKGRLVIQPEISAEPEEAEPYLSRDSPRRT